VVAKDPATAAAGQASDGVTHSLSEEMHTLFLPSLQQESLSVITHRSVRRNVKVRKT